MERGDQMAAKIAAECEFLGDVRDFSLRGGITQAFTYNADVSRLRLKAIEQASPRTTHIIWSHDMAVFWTESGLSESTLK